MKLAAKRPVIIGVFLLVVSLISAGCSFFDSPLNDCPIPRPLTEARKLSGVEITSLQFFNQKLYVGTANGLFEFEGSVLTNFFKCRNDDWDGFESVSYDSANSQLWTFHTRNNALFRLDSKGWRRTELPEKKEPYTRDELTTEFRILAPEARLLLQAGKNVWSWKSESQSWESEELPDLQCNVVSESDSISNGCFVSAAPVKGRMFFIVHSDLRSEQPRFQSSDQKMPYPDRVLYKENGTWRQLGQTHTAGFYTRSLVFGKDCVFVRTYDDQIFQISEGGISRIKSLGAIDAFAATSSGRLLVSYTNLGIFELIGPEEWHKRIDHPFQQNNLKHDFELAESGGTIALGRSSYEAGSGRFVNSEVWVSNGDRFAKVLPR